MAFSSGGKAEMNVTPMIDILLVLIIIFLLIVPVAPKGQEASIPREPEQNTDTSPVRTIVIELNRTGAEITINKAPVTWENLRARLIDIYKDRAEKVAFVRADADTDFE
jgi:biopolymer transport protein TolR